MHLGLERGARRPKAERASCPIHKRHVAGRDRDEPEQQPGHHELEREREDEEADVLPVNRIDDAEGLPMPPEQEGLPVPLRRGREQAPGDERGRGEGKDSSARPGDLGPSEGDCEVRPDEEGNRAGDEEVELDSRRHDAPEDVQLAELVEPEGVGKDPRRSVGKKKRHTQDDYDDSRAATRTEDERPLNPTARDLG